MLTHKEIFASSEALKKAGQHDKLLGLFTYLYESSPDSDAGLQALAELSGIYKDTGQMDKAFQLLQQLASALEKKGKFSQAGAAWASIVCGSLYTDGITLPGYASLAQRASIFLERHATKMSHLGHDMSTGRRLKIGILSPDLCLHSLAHLTVQPLANFTQLTQHELHLYHLRNTGDEITRQLQKNATSLTRVYGMDDAAIAKKIWDDKIDVLIDISGYTAETRPGVFAMQPAPAQMGWISGMMTPTGLSCIPYFFSDAHMRPKEVPSQLGSIIEGTTALTYHTLRDKELDVGELPAARNNYISFASFNNPCKINLRVLAAWADILKRVPRSRLHLKTYHELDTMRIYEQMQQYGVNNTQLELMPALPSSTAVQEYYGKHIDIFLDAWPCSGCLTTVEALWMGVPTVSYYEELFSSRQTHSILNSIGITDLSTNSIPDYVNKAVSLAVDLPRLTQLRKDLRARIAASPLQDYGGMARELAAAVEYAWSDTVSKRSKALDYIRKVA